MANEQNLKMFTSEQSREKAAENGRKGGIASGESKRARKTLREELLLLLESEISDKKGNKVSTQAAMTSAILKQALKGNTKAFEIVRDTIGEKPIDKVMIAEVDQAVIDEVEKAVLDDPSASD